MHELAGGRTLPLYPLPGILAGSGGLIWGETMPTGKKRTQSQEFTRQGTRQLRKGRISMGVKVSHNFEFKGEIARLQNLFIWGLSSVEEPQASWFHDRLLPKTVVRINLNHHSQVHESPVTAVATGLEPDKTAPGFAA